MAVRFCQLARAMLGGSLRGRNEETCRRTNITDIAISDVLDKWPMAQKRPGMEAEDYEENETKNWTASH
ncbi:unnamed protein product [Pieris macdunnoughi]|uniref:Uncharacterized protein n=1 Tax=Pieris macdunnoughi TaxID=345717 RepID=A0A821RYX3_9NEOP|nr:unnamed protein product [Pieris macdunnoughi]